MGLAERLVLRRAEAETRRAARERRRRIQRELAAYASPADRADFLAMLDRYDDGVTQELRDIVTEQATAPRPGRDARRWRALG